MKKAGKFFINSNNEVRIAWTIALALTSFIVFLAVFGYLAKQRIFHFKDDGFNLFAPLGNRIISKFFALLSILIPSVIIIRQIERRPLKLIGLSLNKSAIREHFVGVLIGGCLITIGALIYSSANFGEFQLAESIEYPLFYYLLCVLVFFVSALYEELFFRGYIFQKLIEGTNYWIAQCVAAIFFGLAHLGTDGFTAGAIINAMLAGFLLGQLYYTTRSLWMPIGLHWSWNFLTGPIFGMENKPFFKHSLLTYEKNSIDSAAFNYLEDSLFILILVVIIFIFQFVNLIRPVDTNLNPWRSYPSRIKMS